MECLGDYAIASDHFILVNIQRPKEWMIFGWKQTRDHTIQKDSFQIGLSIEIDSTS